MKIVDLLNIGFKEFVSNNKKVINIILLTICFILVLISISYSQSIKDYWNNSAKKLVDFRTYYVYYDTSKYTEQDAIKFLKNQDHIVDVATSASNLISMTATDFITNTTNGNIYLIGTTIDGIKSVVGENLKDEENTIICAKQFYPQIENSLSDYNTKKIVDITDKVGKTINLSFPGSSNSNEKMKLVGVYDAREYSTNGTDCYTTFSNVERLNMKYQPDVYEKDSNTEYPLIIVLDSIDSKDIVLEKIKEMGFNFDTSMLMINPELGNEIIKISSIGAVIVIILTLFINFLFMIKDFNDKKSYYALLKSYGYFDKQITIIKYINYLIISLLAFLLALPLTIVITNIIKKWYFMTKLIYINIKFSIKINSIIISLIICVLFPLILCIAFNKKTKKVNIIEELK